MTKNHWICISHCPINIGSLRIKEALYILSSFSCIRFTLMWLIFQFLFDTNIYVSCHFYSHRFKCIRRSHQPACQPNRQFVNANTMRHLNSVDLLKFIRFPSVSCYWVRSIYKKNSLFLITHKVNWFVDVERESQKWKYALLNAFFYSVNIVV